jgi:hypothetical protein
MSLSAESRHRVTAIGAERDVDVDEPFELVSHTYERVFAVGRVRAEDSSRDELVVQVDGGSTLGGRVVGTIVATPRHVGEFRSVA